MSPVCVASAPGFAPVPGTIAGQLRRRLLSLDYPAFARCACKLLEALGYEEARPAGRKEWKGYNRPGGGGYDLEAVLPGGLVPRRVLVQLKHYDAPTIHQRNVDELRGACLRAGGAEALLITTSSFSRVVRTAQASGSHGAAEPENPQKPENPQFVPVRLIDGQELLGLLIRYRLGVRERIRGGACRLEIDEAFFMSLADPEDIKAWGNFRTGNSLVMGNNIRTGGAAPSGTISSLEALPPQENSRAARWRVIIRISQAGDGLPGKEWAKGGR